MTMSFVERLKYDRQDSKYRFAVMALIIIWIISIPMKNAIFQICLVLIPLSFLFIAIQNKELIEFIRQQSFTKGVFLFVIVISLANINAINFMQAWNFEFRLFKLIFCLYALVYFLKKKYISVSILVVGALFSFVIQSVDGLVQYLNGYDFIGKTMLDGRMKAMVFHPNTFGLILALGIVISSWILLHKQYFRISFLVASLLIIIMTIASFDLLQTTSRGSWVASVVAITVYFWLERKNLHSRYYIFAFVGFLGLFYYIYSDPHIISRFRSLFEGQSAGRDVIWPLAFHYITLQPLFGYGFDAFRLLPNVPSYGQMPHNIILEILLATGIVGLGMILWLWYRIYRKTVSYKVDEPRLFTVITALFIVLLVGGMFDHSIYQNAIYDSIWIILISIVYKR